MPRVLPGFRVLHRLEGLDDEADRGVADRVGRGLEPGSVGRLQQRPEFRGGMDEHALLARATRVRRIKRRGVRSQGSVRKDFDRSEPEPRIPEACAKSALKERRHQRIPQHRVDADAQRPAVARPLIRLPAGSVHDIVDRGDAEAVGHLCDRCKARFNARLSRLESAVERSECIFLEDACRPARPVDVESPLPDEVRREFEGFRIQ